MVTVTPRIIPENVNQGIVCQVLSIQNPMAMGIPKPEAISIPSDKYLRLLPPPEFVNYQALTYFPLFGAFFAFVSELYLEY